MAEEKLTLNGQPVDPAKLAEMSKNKKIRLKEDSPGQFKTLEKMTGDPVAFRGNQS